LTNSPAAGVKRRANASACPRRDPCSQGLHRHHRADILLPCRHGEQPDAVSAARTALPRRPGPCNGPPRDGRPRADRPACDQAIRGRQHPQVDLAQWLPGRAAGSRGARLPWLDCAKTPAGTPRLPQPCPRTPSASMHLVPSSPDSRLVVVFSCSWRHAWTQAPRAVSAYPFRS
jgi:hypothetical protein